MTTDLRAPRSIRTAQHALALFESGAVEAAYVRLQDLATWQIQADLAKAAAGEFPGIVEPPEPFIPRAAEHAEQVTLRALRDRVGT